MTTMERAHALVIGIANYHTINKLPKEVHYISAESRAETAISDAQPTAGLCDIPAHKVVVIFNCCDVGGISQPTDATAPELKVLPDSYVASFGYLTSSTTCSRESQPTIPIST